MSSSTSDNSKYVNALDRASGTGFGNFKQDRDYQQILEHISSKLGQAYLDHILEIAPALMNNAAKYKTNDTIGNPSTYTYGKYGTWSPTTLRYIDMVAQLSNLFGDLSQFNIVEVGAGYGGQAKIIQDTFNVSHYTTYDLSGAVKLQKRYSEELGFVLDPRPYTSCVQETFDLFISNYSFSECTREIQDMYIDRLIRHSTRGFIMWNETRRSYKLEELLTRLPFIEVLEEFPNSCESNKLLIWGR